MAKSDVLTLYSFGYWGWGNHTQTLVELIDHYEAQHGHEPPLFADIRIRRSGRAKGFVQNAFANLVGPNRYVWLNGLGNLALVEGGKMRLKDPTQIKTLLDYAVANHPTRHVIFFCACEEIVGCHRLVVTGLLLKEAARRKIPAVVLEYPTAAF